MAHATKESAGAEPVFQVVATADFIDFSEHFGHAVLHAA
jgi:hypothetical protein